VYGGRLRSHFPRSSNRFAHTDALKAAGIDEVIVYCVNDAAVMTAWAEDQGVKGSMIKFFADPSGTFTDAIDMKITNPGLPSVGIIGRCKRHVLYVEDGIVNAVCISEGPDDPGGDEDPSATLAEAILEIVTTMQTASSKTAGQGMPNWTI